MENRRVETERKGGSWPHAFRKRSSHTTGRRWAPKTSKDIVADYSEDAILVVQKKVYRGKDGAREVFTQLLSDVPQAQWELDTVFADDVLYLEWKATGGGRRSRTASTHSSSRTA